MALNGYWLQSGCLECVWEVYWRDVKEWQEQQVRRAHTLAALWHMQPLVLCFTC